MKPFIHEKLMRWIQNQMKNAMGMWEDEKIPLWILIVLHISWWALGMVIVTAMYPFVLLVEWYEARAELARKSKATTTAMTKGQVVV